MHELVNSVIEKNPRLRILQFNEAYKKICKSETDKNQTSFTINDSEYQIKPPGHKRSANDLSKKVFE